MTARRTIAPLVACLAVAVLMLDPAPAAAQGDVDMLALGKSLYGQSCIGCHGANGQGITEDDLKIGFAPGRDADVVTGRGPSLVGVGALAADFELRTGYMPLARAGDQPRHRDHLVFSDKEIQGLVAYVASLGPGPAVPRPDPGSGDLSEGKRLFTEHCAGCHQVVAQGGYVTRALAPPLQDATATQVAEAVRLGPYVMPRFTTRSISDRDLNSIIRYVQSTKDTDDFGGWGIGNIGPVPEGLVAWFLGGVALIAACLAVGTRFRRREDE